MKPNAPLLLSCLLLLPSCSARRADEPLFEPPRMASAPLSEDAEIQRLAFGACYVPQFERPEIWRQVSQTSPDAFLFLGDNVYQSEENGRPELRELREAYGLLAQDQPFADLRQTVPVLPIWDDHDYGLNDAGAD